MYRILSLPELRHQRRRQRRLQLTLLTVGVLLGLWLASEPGLPLSPSWAACDSGVCQPGDVTAAEGAPPPAGVSLRWETRLRQSPE